MPMYSPPVRGNQSAAQQMQIIGRGAPQQGNYGGGRASGAASTQRVPGLATALSGSQQAAPTGPQRPAATGASTAPRIPTSGGYTMPPQRQPSPAQGQNRAFANWGEPGSAYGPPPPPPTAPQQPGQTWTGAPVQGYRLDTGGGMNAMMERRQGGPPIQQPQNETSGHGASHVGPPMMGPATGQMSLSGAISGQNNPTHRSSMSMSPDFNPSDPVETSRWIMDNVPGWSAAAADLYDYHPERIPRDLAAGNTGTEANNGHGSGWQEPGRSAYDPAFSGGRDDRGVLGNLGRQAGKAASAFPSGFASGLNENELKNVMEYYDNFSDIAGEKNAGNALLDPEQQAAADAAERAQMQAGINSQRDEQLRMMMGQQGRGGMVGSGASTGLLNSALRAQALGEQNLAQDQYQRMLGRNQLGGQLISDYGRQKYGIMNDQYTSGGDIAALILGGAKEAAGVAGSAAQGGGSGLASILSLFL